MYGKDLWEGEVIKGALVDGKGLIELDAADPFRLNLVMRTQDSAEIVSHLWPFSIMALPHSLKRSCAICQAKCMAAAFISA